MIHIKRFNDRVQQMLNQNTKQISLSRKEATDLLHDITNLLADEVQKTPEPEPIELKLDGDKF